MIRCPKWNDFYSLPLMHGILNSQLMVRICVYKFIYILQGPCMLWNRSIQLGLLHCNVHTNVTVNTSHRDIFHFSWQIHEGLSQLCQHTITTFWKNIAMDGNFSTSCIGFYCYKCLNMPVYWRRTILMINILILFTEVIIEHIFVGFSQNMVIFIKKSNKNWLSSLCGN